MYYYGSRSILIYTEGKHKTTSVEEFLSEGINVAGHDHQNILSPIGITVQGNKPRILLPYMQHGDMKNYLKKQDVVSSIRLQSC